MIVDLIEAAVDVYDGCRGEDKAVLDIKNGVERDVVTKLDLDLHATLSNKANSLESCVIYSEEGVCFNELIPFKDTTVIIDPLDGSHNFQIGNPWYCTIICVVKNYRIVKAGVYSPIPSDRVVWDNGNLQSSFDIKSRISGPTYFAYPPDLNQTDMLLRNDLLGIIDDHSTGHYRWGSAGIGLLELLKGKLQTFVGFNVRIWDAIAFLPLLYLAKCHMSFKVFPDNKFVLIASWNSDAFVALNKRVTKAYGILHKIDKDMEIKFDQ
jgi:myo-inositol-1(or 4)-monophosphatase